MFPRLLADLESSFGVAYCKTRLQAVTILVAHAPRYL